MLKHLFLVIFLLSIQVSSMAQERVVNRSTIMWDQYALEASINPKWSLYFDGGGRFYNFYGSHFLTFFRPGLIYKISPNWELAGGYALFISHPGAYIENRGWQQVIRKDQLGKWQISQRFRSEQRFLNSAKGSRDVLRLRYQLALLYPILPDSKKLMLNLFQEILPVWGDAVPANHLDQFRSHAGVNYSFNGVIITAGYQYIWQWTSQELVFNESHCLRIVISQKINF